MKKQNKKQTTKMGRTPAQPTGKPLAPPQQKEPGPNNETGKKNRPDARFSRPNWDKQAELRESWRNDNPTVRRRLRLHEVSVDWFLVAPIIYTTLTKANVKLYVTLPTINPANFNWAEPHLPVIPITNCYSAYYVKLGKTSHQAV